jgi:hypothetical protein
VQFAGFSRRKKNATGESTRFIWFFAKLGSALSVNQLHRRHSAKHLYFFANGGLQFLEQGIHVCGRSVGDLPAQFIYTVIQAAGRHLV